MYGDMQAVARKKTQWQEDLFFAVKLARQKQSKNHAEVTATMGMLRIAANILDPFQGFRLVRKWDKWIDISPEDETFYTTQYHEEFLKYVENEYCAKYLHVTVNKPKSVSSNNHVPSPMASGSGQSSFDSYDLSSDEM